MMAKLKETIVTNHDITFEEEAALAGFPYIFKIRVPEDERGGDLTREFIDVAIPEINGGLANYAKKTAAERVYEGKQIPDEAVVRERFQIVSMKRLTH